MIGLSEVELEQEKPTKIKKEKTLKPDNDMQKKRDISRPKPQIADDSS